MNNKRLLARIRQFIRQNPIAALSALVLSFGGLPLLLYSNSVDQLPDFTLSDLTGTLIATFATEVTLAAAVGLYCLLAGLAARMVLDRFYPDDPVGVPPPAAPSLNATVRQSLVKGPFIVLVTVLTVVVWADGGSVGTGVSPFVHWRDTTMEILVSTAYFVAYVTLVCLVLFDWHGTGAMRRIGRKVVWGLLLIATIFSCLAWVIARHDPTLVDTVNKTSPHPVAWAWRGMAALSWLGYVPIGLGVLVSVVALATAVWRWLMNRFGWSVIRMAMVAAAPWGLLSLRKDGIWAALSDSTWLPWTILAGAAVAAGGIWLVIELLRRVRRAWQAGGIISAGSRPDWKLVAAKAAMTAAFGIFSTVVMLFVLTIVGSGSPVGRDQTLMTATALLIVLNWIAFSLPRGWKHLAGLCAFSAAVMLFFVPLVGQNPLQFPRLLVTALGFGNRHAASIALSGQQCATLAPYGVHCEKGKDDAITLTNVNIVNRLGTSMQLELLVRTDAPGVAASDAGAQPVIPTSAARGSGKERPKRTKANHSASSAKVVSNAVQVLTLAVQPGGVIDAEPLRNAIYRCDTLLSEKLQAAKEAVASGATAPAGASAASSVQAAEPHSAQVVKSTPPFACARITVPKDQVLGYTSAGVRTYEAGLSGYIPAPAKQKKE
ncbi:hypothetical protein [Burkholderia metallica]|uniref:hypothetical protein n=1 Tax=Burkholderia metallica TaxID=488729 RepID=UPI001CF395B0|nr:hypothetical protein [Burkholderia metallica]MCA8002002.1 hypothetical protein [Burkholderia metallica]